ncbi:hypothetical protein Fmac_025794 [Flemingia macrophylla]|uniref:Uncharacterized protein n=1 Tax=Flemingia macrophylla TaxID=520843 RepID=A0ABD1LD21_9FABA
MTDVSTRGDLGRGLVEKSSLYTPFYLYKSASLIGVEPLKNEIPLGVALAASH